MAGSPFGPDEAVDPTASLDSGPDTSQPGASPDVRSKRLDAALAALSALAMFAPGAKGLAAVLGLGGLTAANAASKKKAAPEVATAAQAPAAAPGEAPPAIQDEFTAREQSLKEQLAPWVAQLQKGGRPAQDTQKVVDGLNAQLAEIATERKRRADTATAAGLDSQKRSEDERKAHESLVRRLYAMGIGGGLGVGVAGLATLASRRQMSGAIKAFEGAGDVAGKLAKEPGNIVVSKGGKAAGLQSAVNEAYAAGGARPPLPPLQDVYAAGNVPPAAGARGAAKMQPAEDALNTAKTDFRTRAAEVPPDAPFSKDNIKKIASLGKITEVSIPAGFAAESAGTAGVGYFSDNPDRKNTMYDMAAGGGTAAATSILGRKLGGIYVKSMKPKPDIASGVNAGRERLQNDVQGVGLRNLQDYQKQMNDIGTGNLPAAKRPFKLGDLDALKQARYSKSAQGVARNDFVANAHAHPDVTQAHAASVVNGQVDPVAFRRALRQALGSRIDHQGQTVKVDDKLVAAIMKAFAGGP